MSVSAEDAVAKAKAIAAKLLSGTTDSGPNNTNNSNSNTNNSNTVNASDLAKAAEAALAGLETAAAAAAAAGGGAAKRKRWGVAATAATEEQQPEKQRIKHEAQKRLWIATSDKPASHYRLFWETNGPSITRQVSAGEIALSLQGRGSSKTPALPGIPEQVSR